MTLPQSVSTCRKNLAGMVYIELNDVAAALLPAVRQLQGTVAERMHITGAGACSIHSVWGDGDGEALFKTNARTFFRDAFGRTAVCKIHGLHSISLHDIAP